MKKLLLSAGVLALVTGSASAADLPVEAPVAPIIAAPVDLWTGFYIGGQVGFAFNNDDDENCRGVFGDSFEFAGDDFNCRDFGNRRGGDDDDTNFFAGLHVGYDQQFGSWVVGAVLDANWLGNDDDNGGHVFDLDEVDPIIIGPAAAQRIRGDDVIPGTFPTIAYGGSSSTDWFGTLRGRVGFAPGGGRFLVYGTGGLAFGSGGDSGRVEAFFVDDGVTEPAPTAVNGAPFDGSNCTATTIDGIDGNTCRFRGGDNDDVEFGWALGAGAEFLATDNFSIGLEYLFVNLGDNDGGNLTIDFEDGTSVRIRDNRDNDFHTVSLKASYRF